MVIAVLIAGAAMILMGNAGWKLFGIAYSLHVLGAIFTLFAIVCIILGIRNSNGIVNETNRGNKHSKDVSSGMPLAQILARDNHYCVRQALAHNPNTPLEILEQLADDPEDSVRSSIARNVNASGALLEKLCPDMDSLVSQNPSTPAHLLRSLAQKDQCLRQVAENPNTPAEVLEQLAEVYPSDVAQNPKAPSHILEKLSYYIPEEHPEHGIFANYVRTNVAANPNTPAQILDMFANEKGNGEFGPGLVRYNALLNPSTPTATLRRLYTESTTLIDKSNVLESNGDIQNARNLITNVQSIEDGLSENPSTPAQILHELAHVPRQNTRYKVARNPNTPIEDLWMLCLDSDDIVRKSVAANPHTPSEALSKLAHDQNDEIRNAVARNPSAPIQALRELAEDSSDWVRCSVASNKAAPVEVLEKLFAHTEEPDMLCALAENPSTPAPILMRLSKDESFFVRESLARNPGIQDLY